MNIKLKRTTINNLMKLYREMDLVPRKDFDQNDCDACVIGHAMHHGIINGYTNSDLPEEFNSAINWIGLPLLPEDISAETYSYSIYGDLSEYEFGLLGNYLFGNEYSVATAAIILGGLPNNCNTPADAKKRIRAVLAMADYEIVWSE